MSSYEDRGQGKARLEKRGAQEARVTASIVIDGLWRVGTPPPFRVQEGCIIDSAVLRLRGSCQWRAGL